MAMAPFPELTDMQLTTRARGNRGRDHGTDSTPMQRMLFVRPGAVSMRACCRTSQGMARPRCDRIFGVNEQAMHDVVTDCDRPSK